jgi:hypothetical protein
MKEKMESYVWDAQKKNRIEVCNKAIAAYQSFKLKKISLTMMQLAYGYLMSIKSIQFSETELGTG